METTQINDLLQPQNNSALEKYGLFLSEYAAMLLGSGVHTSRVIRNSKRIGEALHLEVRISSFYKSIILSLTDKQTNKQFNTIAEIPHKPISFELNTSLSSLSWEAVDEQLSYEQIKERYLKIVSKPRLNSWLVLLLVSFANASFCALFGGDWLSIGIVLVATSIGMFVRQKMQAKDVNPFLLFIVVSFIASFAASVSFAFQTTSDIALATSVLFLIPGVPLINGFVDIMEGHVLSGFARLINAFLLILSIAIGLSLSIILVKNNLI